MSARGLDGEVQVFLAELPLHEGRRDCVDRSGSVKFFPELNVTCAGFCPLSRVGPGHITLRLREKEGESTLQFSRMGDHFFKAEVESSAIHPGGNGPL